MFFCASYFTRATMFLVQLTAILKYTNKCKNLLFLSFGGSITLSWHSKEMMQRQSSTTLALSAVFCLCFNSCHWVKSLHFQPVEDLTKPNYSYLCNTGHPIAVYLHQVRYCVSVEYFAKFDSVECLKSKINRKYIHGHTRTMYIKKIRSNQLDSFVQIIAAYAFLIS